MERLQIADGLEFSRLVYGMWRLADDADISVKHVEAKIQAALAQGITTFDQADIYDVALSDNFHLMAKRGIRLQRGPHHVFCRVAAINICLIKGRNTLSKRRLNFSFNVLH